MLTLTLKLEGLTGKTEKYIEKELKYWEEITGKPHEYHISEALFRYFEYMEDARDIEEIKEEREKKSKVELYTTKELNKRLEKYFASKN